MESFQVAMLTSPAAALVAGAGSTDTDAVGTSHGKKRLKTGPESVQRLGFAEPEEGGEGEEGGADEDEEDDGSGALGSYGTARPMDTDSFILRRELEATGELEPVLLARDDGNGNADEEENEEEDEGNLEEDTLEFRIDA